MKHGNGTHIAVILPGGSAGPNSPALLIPSLAAEQVGIDVHVVTYPDFRPDSLEREAAAEFDAVVFDRVREIITATGAERVTFIAKSRGTLFLSTMPPLDVACEAIWVTPLFGLDYVSAGFVAKRWRSLVVAGGADRYHHAATHEEACRRIGALSLVIEGADHALVVDRNAQATVTGFVALAEAALTFLGS